MRYTAIGFLELNSMARGIECCDAMLKVAAVDLIDAHPICPGKYMVLLCGDVDAVKTSIEKGINTAGENFVDSFVIPNVHEQVIPALRAVTYTGEMMALGVVESFSAASAIFAADTAVKSAEINLVEIRLANGMGGKSFFTFTGIVGAVESAAKSAEKMLKDEGLFVASVVIPAPHKDMAGVVI